MNTDARSGGAVMPEEQRSDAGAPSEAPGSPTSPGSREPYPYPYPYPYSPAHTGYPSTVTQRPQEPRRTRWGPWVIGGVLGFVVVGCMLAAVVIAALASVLLSAVTGPEATVTTTRVFAVSGTPSLSITNPAGNVTVQVGGDGQVTAQVMKHAQGRTKAISQANADRMVVDLNQSGSTITVTARFDTTGFDGGTVRRTVDLLVTVPQNANTRVQLGAGNITVRGVSGEMQLVNGAGNVTAENATFSGSSQLKTGAGNVTANFGLAGGSTMDVNVGAGNATLTLPANTPAHVDASTGVGNLTISGWSVSVAHAGPTAYHATGDLNASPTATLTAHVGTGNLTIRSR